MILLKQIKATTPAATFTPVQQANRDGFQVFAAKFSFIINFDQLYYLTNTVTGPLQ
jgi:hypothetical protein